MLVSISQNLFTIYRKMFHEVTWNDIFALNSFCARSSWNCSTAYDLEYKCDPDYKFIELEVLCSIMWYCCSGYSSVLQRYSESHRPHGSQPFPWLRLVQFLWNRKVWMGASGRNGLWGPFLPLAFWVRPVTKEPELCE